MNRIFISLLAMSFLFLSCEKENNLPDTFRPGAVQLAEASYSGSQKLTLWAADSLKTGYQNISFTLTNADGSAVQNANLILKPMMDMGTMKHSSPAEQPVYNPATKMYEAAVVFTMPSGMHQWTLDVTIGEETRTLPVHISNSKLKTTGSYTGTDGIKYQVSLIPGKPFFVGLNNFEILINRVETMMSFPPLENLEVAFYPDMTSMGHSSPNNVNPVSAGNGHYKGKVNFTMTGDWRFHFALKSGGKVVVEDATVDILF